MSKIKVGKITPENILHFVEKEFDAGNKENVMQLVHILNDKCISLQNAYQEGLLQKQFDKDAEIMQLKQQLAEKDKELLEKNREISNLKQCEFVATTLDFNKLSADNCRLREQLEKSEKSNEYFADRVKKADKEIKEIYKEYNKLVEEYNNLKEEVDNNFVDGQKYNELKKQLSEKENEHELLINQFEEETENLRKQIKRESDARKRFVEEVKKLRQQLEKKEYAINNYWQSEKNKKEMFREENKKLREQLAEKDKELKYKTAECEKYKTDYKNCSELEKIMSKECQYCLDNWRASEQDKISFAVDILEQLKEDICKISKAEIKTLKNGYSTLYIDRPEVIIKIDNQIKLLKEGK